MDVERQRHEMFHALLEPREAMTVAVRVQLSPSVVDTRIVAATPRAAALYGYDDPAELEGQFTSMVHVLEDIQRTRLRSTLRALGVIDHLERYEVRLLQRSGGVQRVFKEVEQREVEETMVWICRLEPVITRRPFQPPPLPETVPEEALHYFFGWACVAEMEALLRQRRLLLTSLQDMTIFRQIGAYSRSGPAQLPSEDEPPVERLVLRSPRVYYRYRCLVCGRDWIGGGSKPRMRCTRCPSGVIMRIAAPMPGTIRSWPWWCDANASSVVHVYDVVRRHRHDPGREDAWTRDSAWFSDVQAAGCSSCAPHTSLGRGEPEAYVRKGGMTPQAGTRLLGQCLLQTRDMQDLSIRQVAARRPCSDDRSIRPTYLHVLEHDRWCASLALALECAAMLALDSVLVVTQAHLANALLRQYLRVWLNCEMALIERLWIAKQRRFVDWKLGNPAGRSARPVIHCPAPDA
jgi:PAS domain-containing protein/DNA-directed RNA polymerase subunit RPC12/RpoP